MTELLYPLLTFTAAAAVLTVAPGADTAMVLRCATSQGWRAGVAAAVGVCLGLLVWGACAACGLTALLAASGAAFTVVKWAGAAYLIFLGVKLLSRPGHASAALTSAAGPAPATRGAVQAFRRGLATNLLNPKAGVFYVTFLPQFIPHGVDVAAFSLGLAAIHATLGLIWFSILSTLTAPLGRVLTKPAAARALDRVTGCMFVGFGLRLVLTEAT